MQGERIPGLPFFSELGKQNTKHYSGADPSDESIRAFFRDRIDGVLGLV